MDYTLGGTTEDDGGRRTTEDDGGRRTTENDGGRRMTEDDGGRQCGGYGDLLCCF